jgi:hypothetical protein
LSLFSPFATFSSNHFFAVITVSNLFVPLVLYLISVCHCVLLSFSFLLTCKNYWCVQCSSTPACSMCWERLIFFIHLFSVYTLSSQPLVITIVYSGQLSFYLSAMRGTICYLFVSGSFHLT